MKNIIKTLFITVFLFLVYFQSQGQKLSLFERIKNAKKIAVVKDFMLLDPSQGASYVVGQSTGMRTTFALVPKDYDRLTAFIAETLNRQFGIQSAQVVDNDAYIEVKDVGGIKGRVFVFDNADEDLFARITYIIVYFGKKDNPGEFELVINVSLTFFSNDKKKTPKAITMGKFVIGKYREDLGQIKNLPFDLNGPLPRIDYFLKEYPPANYVDAVKVTIPEGIRDMYIKLEKKVKKKKKK